jgi:hypothetical protein
MQNVLTCFMKNVMYENQDHINSPEKNLKFKLNFYFWHDSRRLTKITEFLVLCHKYQPYKGAYHFKIFYICKDIITIIYIYILTTSNYLY